MTSCVKNLVDIRQSTKLDINRNWIVVKIVSDSRKQHDAEMRLFSKIGEQHGGLLASMIGFKVGTKMCFLIIPPPHFACLKLCRFSRWISLCELSPDHTMWSQLNYCRLTHWLRALYAS